MSAFTLMDVASVIHEAVRRVQTLVGEEVSPPWDEAPEWMKDSTLEGVRGVIAGNSAEQSHEQWMKTRLEAGWTYGEVKSLEHQTSPNLIPYADLPPAQRVKDDVVLVLTKAFLPYTA